ncbi:MAG: YihY family inner membrane protein [Ghiorsea sp.]
MVTRLSNTLRQTQQRFFQHHCMQYASALSYSTLLAIVPLTALLFLFSLQIDLFSSMFEQVREHLLHQLLPTSRAQVEIYLLQVSHNAQSFSYFGISIIFLSAIWLSTGIESAFNHIWQVKRQHRLYLRIPSHMLLWILAPLFIMTYLSLSTWLATLPYLKGMTGHISNINHLLPWLISSFALFLVYRFVPNTKVLPQSALISALAAGLLIELSKWAFTIYITQFAMYEKLYGALAALPIFMLWVWISWVIVLWGAELCLSIQQEQRHR